MSEARAAARIIRLIDGAPQLFDDRWQIVDTGAQWDQLRGGRANGLHADSDMGVLLPLELALAHPECLRTRGPAGIWLAPADDPARAVGVVPVDIP